MTLATEQSAAAAAAVTGPGPRGLALRIRHRTTYRYSTPVSESYNEARLQPASQDGQTCEIFDLRITPAGPLRHYRDFYLNSVQHFEVFAPHAELTVEATSLVHTTARAVIPVSFPTARLKECRRIEQCYDFLQMSRNVSLDVPVWKLAQDAAGGVEDAWAAAQAVMGFIHREFAYDTAATHVNSHTLEVLQLRRGVCQDFAQLMAGMCRALGIPARYVSGYLYNGPAGRLRGAQASHAWVEIYLPGHGWLGLDPTNNQPPDERYVKVAVGRDYADAAPVRGSFKGGARQQLEVGLEIELAQ